MNKKNRYKLIVITVTYKTVDDLPKFIKSYNKHNDLGDDARLIIVDNSPTDYRDVEHTINLYPDIDYISLPNNPGFGAANNKGFELYDSDYVLFINNDVEFLEPVFKKLIEIHEQEPKMGCVGIHQKGGSPSFFRKMDAPPETNDSIFNDEHHFISGAFMFFKSNIFKSVGRFDPKLFMYFEEYDLSRRLIANYYYTTYIPSLHFLHKVGNRRIVSESTWKNGISSFCYLCRKYNLDPLHHSKGDMNRLKKLQLYFLLKLNFNEVLKLRRIYSFRKNYLSKEFNISL